MEYSKRFIIETETKKIKSSGNVPENGLGDFDRSIFKEVGLDDKDYPTGEITQDMMYIPPRPTSVRLCLIKALDALILEDTPSKPTLIKIKEDLENA